MSAAHVALRGPRASDGIGVIEGLRGHLAGGMTAPTLPAGQVSHPLETAYLTAAQAFDAAQRLAKENLAEYGHIAETARTLDEHIRRIRATGPDLAAFGGPPDLADLIALVPEHAAAIYLIPGLRAPAPHLPSWPGAAIILRSDGRTAPIELPHLTPDTTVEQASALLSSSSALPTVCAWLWNAIIEPVLAESGDALVDVTDWILIPTGLLALLPLHAAGSPTTGWVDDRATLRTVHSLLSLTPVTTDAATGPALVAISDATDLRFLPADRAAAHALLPGAAESPNEVTPDTVLTALVEAPTAILSGHATHSLSEGGGLHLGHTTPGTDQTDTTPTDRWLTADDIDRLPIRRRDLAFLSACSSGQIATDLPDEAIGLPTSLLRAGFSSVIATIWPVADHTAFVTLTRYLQLHAHHPSAPPAALLRATRTWLRTLTRGDLIAWIDTELPPLHLPEEPIALLRRWAQNYPDPHPFADPRHWAAYAAHGH